MYDIREELMHKMVAELRNENTSFEIMSDEEFYYSDYGVRRRARNQTCSNVVYMHILVPGNAKNLLGVYFHKKDIFIAVPTEFEDFVTSINVERTVKDVFKKPFIDYRIIRKDYDSMYTDAKNFILELLRFAKSKRLDQIW